MDATKQVTAVMTLVNSFVDELIAALVNSRIYWSRHPRVRSSINEMCGQLAEFAVLTREKSILIDVSKDFLVFKSRPLLGASITAPALIKHVRAWSSGGVQVDVKASTEDFSTFLEMVVLPPNPGSTHHDINTLLERHKCRRIRLLEPYVDVVEHAKETESLSELRLPVQLYQQAVELLQSTTITVCSGGRIQFDAIHNHVERMAKSLLQDDSPMLSLARQEQYDAFTFGHSVRVSVLAMNFVRALTSDSELLVRLGTAALLHDVGKSLVPFEILHSATPLTKEQRAEINRHPACGAEILIDHEEADRISVAIAFGHHRTMDSAGYPETVHEYRQSMVTRIVKICDVYEALTAARPYKRPITPTRAYRIMLAMRNHFDLRLLRKFMQVNGVFPNGQLLEMNTGELVRVRKQGPKLLLPTVEVITDPEGNPLDESARRVVALADIDTFAFRIARSLDEDLLDGDNRPATSNYVTIGDVDLQDIELKDRLDDSTCC